MFRTLIVDDEPLVRDLTSRVLRKHDLPCDTAADGDEAIDMFDRGEYGAVVTDLRMPQRNGHSLAVELLNRPSPPRVLVVTGLAEPRLIRDLIDRGVDDVIFKPVNYDVLAIKVASIAAKGPSTRKAAPPTKAKGEQLSSHQLLCNIERSLVELTDIFYESLEPVFDFDTELDVPPSSMDDFIVRFAQREESELTLQQQHGHETRQTERVRCHAVVTARPVTRKFVVDGDPFMLAIRDVSEGGIRLLHTRATNAKYLALSWPAETSPAQRLVVVAKIRRCQPLGPFYDIGGEFVLAD